MYCDIHTHTVPESLSDNIYILNKIAGKGEELPAGTYFSCGIHPWFMDDLNKQKEILRQQADDQFCVAIGEAGLDKYADACLALQKEIFHYQALLAESSNKPLLIHCVKAWQELLEIHKEIKPQVPWVIHGFRGNKELAIQLLSHGLYLSFGRNFNPQTIHFTPLTRFFVETDDKEISIEGVYQCLIDELQVDTPAFVSRIRENVRNIFFI